MEAYWSHIALGQRNELHRLTTRRNRQLEQLCHDSLILDDPFCTTRILEQGRVKCKKRETTVNI